MENIEDIEKSRKRVAGDNWHRVNDLPDGDFSRETFDAIIRAIVRYELVAKVKEVEPITFKKMPG